MQTYIIGLFDRANDDNPNETPILEFTIEAENAEAARNKLFAEVVRLEVLELAH
jgi:hypothetical protein